MRNSVVRIQMKGIEGTFLFADHLHGQMHSFGKYHSLSTPISALLFADISDTAKPEDIQGESDNQRNNREEDGTEIQENATKERSTPQTRPTKHRK